MGIQGRYIYWAAATAGIGLVGFVITYCLLGFIAGLTTLVVTLGSGALLIILKQRRGLHTKRIDKGIFVYATSKNYKTNCPEEQ